MENSAAPVAADTSSTPDTGTTAATSAPSVETSSPVSATNSPSATETHLTPQEKATAEAKKYKYKLKINGQEEEVEYDEQSLVKELQKSRAASKIREEAAREREAARLEAQKVSQEREQFKAIVEALRNPQTARQLLRQIGTPLEELSKAELEDYIKYQQMTPEQRELHELRTWKQQQEEQKRVWQQQQEEQQRQSEIAEAQNHAAGKIIQTLNKLGLKETDSRAASELAKTIAYKMEHGGWDLSPDDLAEEIREDLREQHRIMYGSADGNLLFGLLGEEGLKKAQTFATSRVPQVPSVDNPPKAQEAQAPASGIPQFKTRKEWLEYVDSLPSNSLED